MYMYTHKFMDLTFAPLPVHLFAYLYISVYAGPSFAAFFKGQLVVLGLRV